jgi:hypothetical protein
VVEDLFLESLEACTRLDADLVEHRTDVPVDLERFGLSPRAVQRQHLLLPQPLAVRIRGDQRLQFADELGVAAEREVRLDSLLERGNSEVVEPAALDLRERLVCEFRQSRSSPEVESLAEHACRTLWIPRG